MADATRLLSHFFLKLDGQDASEDLARDLLEITVENSLHLPDVATVTLHDPRQHWVDEARLAPGKAIQVAAQIGSEEEIIFDGEIVEMEPDFGPSTQSLIVRAFDRLHRLARGRHVRTFQNVTDGDLVQKIAQEVGLQAHVGPTSRVHPYVFQANETNLAFLQGRAAALGYLLFVEGKTLHCEAPTAGGQAIELEWGTRLSTFRPRLTTIDQITNVTARGWDPLQYQEIVGQARDCQGAPQLHQAQQGGEVAQQAFQLEASYLVANRPIRTQAEADQLAQAEIDRHAGHFVEAEGTCGGNPALVAGASLRIRGVGERFSGTYFVTGATHTFAAREGYHTTFHISGLHPATLLSLLRPARESFGIGGLVIGLVTDNQDPKGLGRVKVKYPWLSADHTSDWVRLATPGGGAERGIQFLPEVNDEVLIGFELDDIHHPYVLGGLWNGQDAPPRKSDQAVQGGKVQQRIIRSRSGHQIILNDEDSGGGITITDKQGNKIQIDSGENSLTVEVQGAVTVKARSLKLEAQEEATLTAQNLTLEARGQVELKGNAGIKIDGGPGTVDVKGSLINLN
jgi:phage protein D